MYRLFGGVCAVALGGAMAILGAGCGGSSPSATGAGGSAGNGGSGGSTGGGGTAVQTTSGPYQPLVVNATWTYHVNDKGLIYDKMTKFEAQEDLGGPKAGTMAFRMRETMPSESQLTWYHAEGD